MEYPAAATVVALIRDLPQMLTLGELGDELLEAGSAEQMWAEHGQAARDRAAIPPGEEDRSWQMPSRSTPSAYRPALVRSWAQVGPSLRRRDMGGSRFGTHCCCSGCSVAGVDRAGRDLL